MSISADIVLRALALGVPLVFGVASWTVDQRTPFVAALRGTALALGITLALAIGFAIAGPLPLHAHLGVRLDPVTVTMLLLVALLAVVVARYSRSYLDGDPGRARYARWLLATLACASALIVSGNLLYVAFAWTLTSLSLHQLLTFYATRSAAQVAAHKKFLFSRLADVALWSAILLVRAQVGSFDIEAVHAWARTATEVPPSIHLAGVLLALAAALKSAQIPFHGWLIQVMEAPTPVSALLHAGIVNLGGLLMLRLYPLVALVPAAQLCLVVVGLASVVVASLVTTTRVSIKVALAWSTCAQMGFMLVECGLQAWHLALVHLLAHSFYKAHAFLRSGSAVAIWRSMTLVRHENEPAPGLASSLARHSLTVALVVGPVLLSGHPHGTGWPSNLPFLVLAGLALASTAWRGLASGRARLGFLAQVAAVTALYLAWDLVAQPLFPGSHARPWLALTVLATLGFVLLHAVQSLLRARPDGAFARAVRPWLFAGLYLDEHVTRLMFRMWPPKRPAMTAQPFASTQSVEV